MSCACCRSACGRPPAIVHQIEPSLEEASINLAASPLRTFIGLVVPLMAGGLVGGMVLVWTPWHRALSSTIVLYTSRWSTITVRMYRQLLEGTGAGLAAAAALDIDTFHRPPAAAAAAAPRRRDSPLM